MNKKEIKQQITAMLDAGRSKTETFKAFSGGAVKDRVLAYWIGSHPDPARNAQHQGKVKVLLGLMIAQALLGALTGFSLGALIGPKAMVIFTLIGGLIPLWFAYGFYKYRAQFYTVYVILSLSQASQVFKGFSEDPVSTLIGAAIGLGLVFFVAWLKTLLFPDLNFIGPKKIKGQYVFSN
ncbi:hypothetical protein [Pseudomonas nunensis]|uniref:Uncharacterized protein n=1 Tax=Pseudomonas nunensis TaxID=2961896 RepID=A0ABY5EP64_9PSED|nr:hypothetical protein [Pseudomonas nunensis]KPN91228.1 hypothetical protein AL066_13070 [Pseudomonas nunensis]MCL5227517.1 hypothetical protein [Pseudomonas nunensis]UTO17496.1 hypothetical protein NK667_14440 [Pseudomonas nunensis]